MSPTSMKIDMPIAEDNAISRSIKKSKYNKNPTGEKNNAMQIIIDLA